MSYHALFRLGGAVAIFAATLSAAPNNVHFNGGNGSPWGNTSSWVESVSPGNSDNAIVSSGRATIAGNLSVGLLTFSGGTIDGTGSLTLAIAGSSWTSGQISLGGGSVTIGSVADLTISSTTDHDFNATAINNNGTIQWSAGRLRSGNGGGITNSGSFNDAVTANTDLNTDFGGSSTFTNASGGTYTKSGNATTRFSTVAFNNSGHVNLHAGTLELHSGGTNATSGTLHADSGASVVFSSDYTIADLAGLSGAGAFSLTAGTLTANGHLNVSNFAITGGRLAGSQTVAGALGWSNGDLNSAGTTTIASGGTLTISGSNDHDFSGRSLVNSGTVNWNGGRLRSGNSGGITNNATFNDDTTSSTDLNTDYGGANSFTNAAGASFNKSGNGITRFWAVPFDNSGAVNLHAGTFELHGGGTNSASGTIHADTGTSVVFSNDYTITDLAGLSGTGAFSLTAGTLTANGHLNAPNFAITGGRLAGTQTVHGALGWSNGDLNSAGTTTIASGATLTISGSNDHDFSGRSVVNSGTVNWNGGRLRSGNSGGFTNNATFNDDTTSSTDLNTDYGGANRFTNAAGASFNKSGNGTTRFSTTPFDNNGAVNLHAGTFELHGGGTNSASGTIHADTGTSVVFSNDYTITDLAGLSGTGAFSLIAGTLTANGHLNVSNFGITGGRLAGTQTVHGALGWSNGDLDGAGTTTIDNGATLTISSSNDHDFNGHSLVNSGTVNWNGGRLRSGNSGSLINHSLFVDAASADMNNDFGGTTAAMFTNNATATYRKTGNGVTRLFIPLVNSGLLEIQNGTLALNADSTLNNGSSMTGSGLLQLVSGRLLVNGSVSLANFEIAGGTVDGTHTFSGTTRWSGGNFNSSGVTSLTGALTIDGGADHDFNGHSFDNHSTVTWSGGRLRSGNGGVFQNNGVFNDSASNVWNNDLGGTAAPQFLNGATATYNKTGSGTTTFNGVPFVNSGTINVQAGALEFQGGGSAPVNAHFNASAGAAFRFTGGNFAIADGAALAGSGSFVIAGGTVTIGATISAADVQLTAGSLGGTHTFTSRLNWSGGHMNNSGTTTIASGALLMINGNTDHDFDGHTLVNNGTVDWNAGRLRGGHGATITNNGVFNDSASSEINNDFGGTVVTFTNGSSGVFAKSSGGTTTVAVPFINNGAVVLSAGTTVFSGSFTNHGSLALANGAVAQFASPLSFSTAALTGTGTINASAVTAGGLVAPGNSPGTLTLTGDLTLLSTSLLLIDLGGTTQGSGYDFLNVGGNAAIDGVLTAHFVNGFNTSVSPANTFTILTASGTGGLTGAFANVANGQRIVTTDGLGSFQVNYGPGSTFGLNSVVLSNFQAVPEPSTYVLLGLGSGALLLFRRRARRR